MEGLKCCVCVWIKSLLKCQFKNQQPNTCRCSFMQVCVWCVFVCVSKDTDMPTSGAANNNSCGLIGCFTAVCLRVCVCVFVGTTEERWRKCECDGEEGSRYWMFGSFGFISGHPSCCGCVLGHVSLQILSAFGSSLVQQNLDPHVSLFLVTVLCSCSALMALGWAGLGWFGSMR